MTSGSKCCDHEPSSYQNHSVHYKKPYLTEPPHVLQMINKQKHLWLLATVRWSQLMQIFCCHSCHTGITSVPNKSPPCRTEPCPKAVDFPRTLTWPGHPNLTAEGIKPPRQLFCLICTVLPTYVHGIKEIYWTEHWRPPLRKFLKGRTL